MDLTDRLTALIAPTLEGMGYDLVRVAILGARRQTVQIMAERRDGAAMSVEDCTALSRALSALLDVEDPIPGPYALEVSSPGIDRPLTRRKDFAAWAGFEAKIEAKGLVDDRRRFSGVLKGMDDQDRVVIVAEDGERHIPFDFVARAKLVLTDALIAAIVGPDDGRNRQNKNEGASPRRIERSADESPQDTDR